MKQGDTSNSEQREKNKGMVSLSWINDLSVKMLFELKLES